MLTLPSERLLGVFASYFETHSLLRMSAFRGKWRNLSTTEQLISAARDGSVTILFIEPVQYNWSLTTTPWRELMAAIDDSPDPPIVWSVTGPVNVVGPRSGWPADASPTMRSTSELSMIVPDSVAVALALARSRSRPGPWFVSFVPTSAPSLTIPVPPSIYTP